MTDCCGSTSDSCARKIPLKRACPLNGEPYPVIETKTLLQHVKQPWRRETTDQTFYFCQDSECSVIYFSDDDVIIEQDDVRTRVGEKERTEQATLCYCFGIEYGDYAKNPELKAFVVEKTQQKYCACEIRNPSGRCCLKHFVKPKALM